ncbi:MAG: type 4a pilus biogenesis protein PilO [Planctomycetota bacterium]|jgi:Tfp pilus assembly protein PilO
MAILTLAVVVGLGGLLLAWPAYREAAALDRQTQELRAKGERYDLQAEQIKQLKADLDEATRRVETRLKQIPETPDIAGLMRVLSLAVDETNVRDQMFDAGDPKGAAPGSELSAQVTPLTVELKARFDAVFALLRAAESMDRLLRVSSLRVVCNRPNDGDDAFTEATVVLEAVYDPPDESGEG